MVFMLSFRHNSVTIRGKKFYHGIHQHPILQENIPQDNPILSLAQDRKHSVQESDVLFINCGLGGKRPIHTLATPKSYTAYSYSPTNQYNIGWIRYKSEPKRVNIVTGAIISNAKLTISFYEYNMPTFFQSIFGSTAQEIQKDQVSIEISSS